MARTILEIGREAAERHATAPAPATLFGSNSRVARILRVAAADTIREYLRKTTWLGSSELHSTWVFTLQPGRYAYELPPDFLKIIPRTEMRRGWEMGLVGPATPEAWARWLSGVVTATAPMGWRIKSGLLWIEPPPATVELVTIEYISRYPVVSQIKEGDYDMSASPVTANAPIVPRDGFMDISSAEAVIGDDPTDAAYEETPGYDVATWPEELYYELRRIDPGSVIAPLPMVRREAFEADTDLPAFSDDHLLSLGMTYRLRRALGLDYVEAAAEYEGEMESKIVNDAGGVRTFEIGRDEYYPDTVPLGDGKWMLS